MVMTKAQRTMPHGMEPPDETPNLSGDFAFRLLQLQQRLDAWDLLYNEEINQIHKELAAVKTDYLRLRQAQVQGAARGRKRKPVVAAESERGSM
jgi:hypothetical protein